jgi:UDP-glucose 4-epimerase
LKSLLLTGATGFVGQRLLHRLEEKDKRIKVKIISRRLHKEYETVIIDLQTDSITGDVLRGVDTVFHLAGYAHVTQDSSKVVDLYRSLNVVATVRLAELAVESGIKRFVFVSSAKAGGKDEFDEGHPPEGVYGQTKREAELKILEIGRQSGMHISIVRPCLIFGDGAKGNLALMFKGIEQGWFPPLPETNNRRSLIHVDDLVQALLLVAEDERANGEIFIATDGVTYSSREIYVAICQSVGKTVPKWKVPKFFFEGLSFLSPRIRYKVDKLLGDEYYSSKKLERLGFRAEKSLRDIGA